MRWWHGGYGCSGGMIVTVMVVAWWGSRTVVALGGGSPTVVALGGSDGVLGGWFMVCVGVVYGG